MKYKKFILLSILLFAYCSRLWRLSIPTDYYFDEVYHAFTAQYYATNSPHAYEWWHKAPEGVAYEWLHPPVAKLFQGFSIYLLGNNSFAWRLPSAIFGTLVIAAIYLFAKNLTGKESAGLLAAFVASMDGLLLTLSRITMNDIFVTFFMIMAFNYYWLYIKKRRTKQELKFIVLAGLFSGLAMATKWSGIFTLLVFWASEMFLYLSNKKTIIVKRLIGTFSIFVIIPGLFVGILLANFSMLVSSQPTLAIWYLSGLALSWVLLSIGFLGFKKPFYLLFSFVLLPIAIYLLSFGQFWLHDRENNLQTFKDLHYQIWWYQTHLEATHPWGSRPQEWLLNLKPVWFYVKYLDGKVGNIYALANPAIAWIGLTSIVWLTVQGVATKKWHQLYLAAAYLSIWLPWVFSPRIMFFYHYTPAVALLSIAISIWISQLMAFKKWWAYTIGGLMITSIVGLFIYFYPHWTGVVLSSKFANTYFWFETWKP